MANDKVYYATGRRKTSAARVFLRPGSGKLMINGRAADDYFNTPATRAKIFMPLEATDCKKAFDAHITVRGGGITGQAEAVRHGISRALVAADEENRAVLKKEGYLTRDPRMVERKKYGLHKARKSTQFSKR